MQNEDKALVEAKQAEIFKQPKKQQENNEPNAGAVVKRVYNKAIEHTVATNNEVQHKVLGSAKNVIDTELNTIETDSKNRQRSVTFESNADAAGCFGFQDKTSTPLWALGMMRGWYAVLTALWVGIGMVTFAPVIFLARKLQVMIKSTIITIILGIAIYLGVLVLPTILAIINAT